MSKILATKWYGEALWNKDEGFGFLGSGKYISTFSNFNTCQHDNLAYYYAPSGYMVKFARQAILISTTICHKESIDEYTVCYTIKIVNINCKAKTCRITCGTEISGHILIHYFKDNRVDRICCETDYPCQFGESFYCFLRDYINSNPGIDSSQVQVYMCKKKIPGLITNFCINYIPY